MRAGAYTIHQSLTAEAAAVLKLALGLARRRGHAQVTPLHVAFALLTGPAAAVGASSSSSAAYGLLKRACLRSHPAGGGAAHTALQCRALELCFNVALNRLPTSAPPGPASSFASSLIQPSPTLSNALVAALKRAQANQRRGCVELHHHQQPPPPATNAQAQQQQPLLAIKVELDQLLISILDDPSVSRVMREAGFSSATVKSNLEEESALLPPPHSSTSPPPQFFLDQTSIATSMWPAQFLAAPIPLACNNDDVRAVLEVMVRKQQGRRGSSSNPVVVGDSASMAEAVAGELLRHLERGGGDGVPEELAGAHLLQLHLSYVHVRLMSRADVDARAAELRRGVDAVQRGGGGLVVYVGDLSWAVDEEHPHADDGASPPYSPVEHMVAELGRLVDDVRASRGRAWIVATASYQTYMRWQRRRRRQAPAVEAAWALQAILVPTGGGTGLALNNLHPSASEGLQQPGMATTFHPAEQSPFAMAPPPISFAERDGQQENPVLCTECSKNYEREASLVKKTEAADTEGLRASLPAWLVPAEDRLPPPADQAQNKDKYLMELKRKWSRLCGKLHLCVDPPCPWWAGPCLPRTRPRIAELLGLDELMAHGNSSSSSRASEWWPPPSAPPARWGLAAPGCHDVSTGLALGNLPLSDTATSDGRAPGSGGDGSASAARELERRLRRNVPWQPGAVVSEIAEAVAGRGQGTDEKAGAVWLYLKGSDRAAVRRAVAVVAEARRGAAVVVCADPAEFGCAEEFWSDVVSRAAASGGGNRRLVLVVGGVERAPEGVVECLAAAAKSGALKGLDLSGSVVILTTSELTAAGNVIGLQIREEEGGDRDASCGGGDLKRKPDTEPSPTGRSNKRRRLAGGLDLNIGLCATDDRDSNDDEGVPSDITHEGSVDVDDHPSRLLESVAAVVTLDDECTSIHDHLRARLAGALDEHRARVDDEVVEALAAASGHFLDETLERWLAEVLEPAVAVMNGGGKERKAVAVLGLRRGGARQATAGFMGSVLPSRVHVD